MYVGDEGGETASEVLRGIRDGIAVIVLSVTSLGTDQSKRDCGVPNEEIASKVRNSVFTIEIPKPIRGPKVKIFRRGEAVTTFSNVRA